MSTFKKWIGSGINSDLKDSVNNNVLNVIRALVEDKDSVIYIPVSYSNSTKYRYSSDPAVHFLPIECGRSITITGLQSNQERFNFSMLGLVDVMVEQMTSDGEIHLVPKKVFRQYNIIKDGELTMDYISAKLSRDSFEALRKIGILYYNNESIVPNNHGYVENFVYKVALKDLPLLSPSWAQPIRIGLVEFMKRESEITTKLKVMKTLLNELPKKDNNLNNEEDDIYQEKHSSGSMEKSDSEPKVVDCVVYSLNLPEFVYNEEMARMEFSDFESLKSAISDYNRELRYVRFIIRCIVYSIEGAKKQKSYDWSDLVDVPRSRSGKKMQTANIEVDGESYVLTRYEYKKSV